MRNVQPEQPTPLCRPSVLTHQSRRGWRLFGKKRIRQKGKVVNLFFLFFLRAKRQIMLCNILEYVSVVWLLHDGDSGRSD